MSLQTHIRFRLAHGASPGEIAELEAVQARMDALEAALLDAQAALEPYRVSVPGTRLLNAAARVWACIDALLNRPN